MVKNRSIFQWVVLLLAVLLLGLGLYVGGSARSLRNLYSHTLPKSKYRPLLPTEALEIHVTPESDGKLTTLEMIFVTYGRTNTCTVRVTLAQAGEILGEVDIPAEDLQDWGMWRTEELNLPVRAGQDLTLTITSPDATGENCVALMLETKKNATQVRRLLLDSGKVKSFTRNPAVRLAMEVTPLQAARGRGEAGGDLAFYALLLALLLSVAFLAKAIWNSKPEKV